MFVSPQQLFAAALLDAERPVPPGLVVRGGARPETGFAVYRNNVTVGLIEAMRAAFPVVERVVGEEFFAALAQVFVTAEPPSTPVLAEYGDGFPAFLATFPPAADIPYLPDLARLERAASRAYHAADIDPIGMAALQAIVPEALGEHRLCLHPAVSVLCSSHPVATIRAMNLDMMPLGPVEHLTGEDVLVARPLLDVQVRMLAPGAAAFIAALAGRRTFAEAADEGFAEASDFDLAQVLALLFAAGAVVAILHDKEAVP